mmetsp:Transcript_28861/g.93224  ORF Transcript_28861/g.93224 Transcript_28861/m.93224 type:complete len:141 (+) Transcript_28861:39-461(+)
MSLKLTTQWDYIRKGAVVKYSKYHPENMDEKAGIVLPPPVKNPEPRELYVELTERDRKIPGVYGHKLCCEPGYGSKGMIDTMQVGVQPVSLPFKIGRHGPVEKFAEKGKVNMCSGIYSSSWRNISLTEESARIAQRRGPS